MSYWRVTRIEYNLTDIGYVVLHNDAVCLCNCNTCKLKERQTVRTELYSSGYYYFHIMTLYNTHAAFNGFMRLLSQHYYSKLSEIILL